MQEDKNNPRPCTQADKEKWGEDGTRPQHVETNVPEGEEPPPVQLTHEEQAKQKKDSDDLFAEMMGDTPPAADAGTEDAGATEDAGPATEDAGTAEEKK